MVYLLVTFMSSLSLERCEDQYWPKWQAILDLIKHSEFVKLTLRLAKNKKIFLAYKVTQLLLIAEQENTFT